MDWMPFFLTFASGSFMVPMLIAFQRQMSELEKKIRAGEAQLQEIDASLRRIAEGEVHVNAEIEKAKAELAELDREREEQERKFREAKKQFVDAYD